MPCCSAGQHDPEKDSGHNIASAAQSSAEHQDEEYARAIQAAKQAIGLAAAPVDTGVSDEAEEAPVERDWARVSAGPADSAGPRETEKAPVDDAGEVRQVVQAEVAVGAHEHVHASRSDSREGDGMQRGSGLEGPTTGTLKRRI